MAWTTPRTWVTSEIVTAAQLNAHLRDNLSFLYTPPMCAAKTTVNVGIANAGWQGIVMNAEDFDTDSMHSTSVNPSNVTATTAGKYLVAVNVTTAGASAGALRGSGIRKNGSGTGGPTHGSVLQHPTQGGNGDRTSHAALVVLAVGEYVETIAYQDNGGTVNAIASEGGTFCHALWVGN